MKFAVVTPFSRYDNKRVLINHLRKHNISWYPIIDEKDLDNWKYYEDWIFPFVYKGNDTTGNPGNIRINEFIKSEIKDDVYYSFLCDDDFYEDKFFDKIFEKQPVEKVIVVSMKRGNVFGFCKGRPTYTLPAAPQNMRENLVGLEQLIIKGDLLKTLRMDTNDACADGRLARELKESGIGIKYLMDTFILFNWLEEGRWNDNTLV